jgi:hypothetical protein
LGSCTINGEFLLSVRVIGNQVTVSTHRQTMYYSGAKIADTERPAGNLLFDHRLPISRSNKMQSHQR